MASSSSRHALAPGQVRSGSGQVSQVRVRLISRNSDGDDDDDDDDNGDDDDDDDDNGGDDDDDDDDNGGTSVGQ